MTNRLTFSRHFTRDLRGIHPFDCVEWDIRTAEIKDGKNNVVFRQDGVEVPKFWSNTATNIVASKYFHGQLGSPDREYSVKQLIGRVVKAITTHGVRNDYFTRAQGEIFAEELTFLLLHQRVSFNSPVWFNIGLEGVRQQASACYILSVEDDMMSILDLIKTEGLIFKRGSGSGTNLSKLREEEAPLSGGGTASGPLSFMKALDASAGVIKSGGGTRRAAILRCMDADHPDILRFIDCKVHEERKAHALIREGYDSSFTGEAYTTVAYQNANNSVQVSDEFMQAVREDQMWSLRSRVDGAVTKTMPAREIFRRIAQAAWESGDPGLQFSDAINRMNTLLNTERIVASNPCSEFLHINDTSCNLASFNLLKFADEKMRFDFEGLNVASRILITAMEVLADLAEYPTEKITERTKATRPLGLGFTNLGTLLMSSGLAYDSDEGRWLAARITSTIAAAGYAQSAAMASIKGPFDYYQDNREVMLNVINKHWESARKLNDPYQEQLWREALLEGEAHGYRNSQVVVIAPAGTISFFLDSTTTGLEPNLALVSYKKMVGEGLMKLVNTDVPRALESLGYSPDAITKITAYIEANDTIEGAPGLRPADLPVFDCSFQPAKGTRSIAWEGHIRMLAAIQPFLSGGASKTINMPNRSTVEDVERAYVMAYELGCKCISIYRDGCKISQPVSTSREQATGERLGPASTSTTVSSKQTMPKDRRSLTHKFTIGEHKGFVTVGLYDDGRPGEIFITTSKTGSSLRGMMDAFAISVSLGLQHGVPLSEYIEKFSFMRFDPAGITDDPGLRLAKSIPDYVFRWLANNFCSDDEREALGLHGPRNQAFAKLGLSGPLEIRPVSPTEVKALLDTGVPDDDDLEENSAAPESTVATVEQGGGTFCEICGAMMVQTGSCETCPACGASGGCG